MKKSLYNLVWVVLYLLALCFLLRASPAVIFSIKHMGIFCLGTVILGIPHLEKGMRAGEWKGILGRAAGAAGCLETLMLFLGTSVTTITSVGSWKEILLQDMMLHLRPMLYAYIVWLVCQNDEAGKDSENEKSRSFRAVEKPVATDASKEDRLWEGKQAGIADTGRENLTAQERRIVQMIRKGMTNREIAQELYIAESTVKKHVSHIFEKLEIKSRKDLK